MIDRRQAVRIIAGTAAALMARDLEGFTRDTFTEEELRRLITKSRNPKVKDREYELKGVQRRELPFLKSGNLRDHLRDKGFSQDFFSHPQFGLYIDLFGKQVSGPKTEINSEGDYRRALGWEEILNAAKPFIEVFRSELEFTEKQWGVARRYVAAIIGIESRFLENSGYYGAFNALVSKYFRLTSKGFKERKYVRREIVDLLEIANLHQVDVFNIPGSHDAAIGWAQFIPSTYQRSFISSEDGRLPDPFNLLDCMFSISHYLLQCGWNTSENSYGLPPKLGRRNGNAIFAYNRSDWYVKSVVDLGDHLGKTFDLEKRLVA